MRPDDPNLPYLIIVADSLGELREQVVFLGGCAAGLLITDPVAEDIRSTRDVDAVAEAATYAQFHQVEEKLATLGFTRDSESEVICRWRHTSSGVLFDLMPVNASVLGFSNRWYPEVVRTATRVRLNQSLEIRLVAAPAFIASKLEAFRDRGKGDFLTSHDLEDVLNVVDGRTELSQELKEALPALREEVARQLDLLIQNENFLSSLPGLIAAPERADIVLTRLRAITEWG